jgi:hypothetical protein
MFVSKQRCNHKQLSDYPHLCCQEVSAAYVFHAPFVACNSKHVAREEQESCLIRHQNSYGAVAFYFCK